jgi:hypothetical protein
LNVFRMFIMKPSIMFLRESAILGR